MLSLNDPYMITVDSQFWYRYRSNNNHNIVSDDGNFLFIRYRDNILKVRLNDFHKVNIDENVTQNISYSKDEPGKFIVSTHKDGILLEHYMATHLQPSLHDDNCNYVWAYDSHITNRNMIGFRNGNDIVVPDFDDKESFSLFLSSFDLYLNHYIDVLPESFMCHQYNGFVGNFINCHKKLWDLGFTLGRYNGKLKMLQKIFIDGRSITQVDTIEKYGLKYVAEGFYTSVKIIV